MLLRTIKPINYSWMVLEKGSRNYGAIPGKNLKSTLRIKSCEAFYSFSQSQYLRHQGNLPPIKLWLPDDQGVAIANKDQSMVNNKFTVI